jgi:ketosteroid isomerase-like protein
MSREIAPERLAELLDRQDIADCLTRFTRGMDRFDRALFVSAYHDDAVIDAGDFVGTAAQVYDMARDLHDEGQSGTLHNVLNHSCDLDGDTAHCETYFFFVGRNRDESNWAAGGRYIDRFERRDGAWKIAFRRTILEWSGMIDGTELPLGKAPDKDATGVPQRGKGDPSYVRPLVNKRVVPMQ